MACPYCEGDAIQALERVTAVGYRLYRCRPCRRTCNERTGTPFTHRQVPTDGALLVVLWWRRYKLSLRDLAAMFLRRGCSFTQEAVREWEARFAPLLTAGLRAKRRGKAGRKWHCAETDVTVEGRWCSRYRASDAAGHLVDSLLSATRDREAATRFFARARVVVGHTPQKMTTDGHDAYPRAIRDDLGSEVHQRTRRSMHNRMEQAQRGSNQRYYPMRGFGSFGAAARFCSAHDELRDHVRFRPHLQDTVSLAEPRRLFQERWGEVCALLQAA